MDKHRLFHEFGFLLSGKHCEHTIFWQWVYTQVLYQLWHLRILHVILNYMIYQRQLLGDSICMVLWKNFSCGNTSKIARSNWVINYVVSNLMRTLFLFWFGTVLTNGDILVSVKVGGQPSGTLVISGCNGRSTDGWEESQ